MPGLSSLLDGWLGILYLIKAVAVLHEKNKDGSYKFMALPISQQYCHSKIQTLP